MDTDALLASLVGSGPVTIGLIAIVRYQAAELRKRDKILLDIVRELTKGQTLTAERLRPLKGVKSALHYVVSGVQALQARATAIQPGIVPHGSPVASPPPILGVFDEDEGEHT